MRSGIAVLANLTSSSSPGVTTTTPVGGFRECTAITIVATIVGATGGPLDVIVDHSADGVDFYEYAHFAQAAAAAPAANYTYAPVLDGAIATVGKNLTATFVLPAGSVANGHWFDFLRVRFIAGASTSAGAAQLVSVMTERQ